MRYAERRLLPQKFGPYENKIDSLRDAITNIDLAMDGRPEDHTTVVENYRRLRLSPVTIEAVKWTKLDRQTFEGIVRADEQASLSFD